MIDVAIIRKARRVLCSAALLSIAGEAAIAAMPANIVLKGDI